MLVCLVIISTNIKFYFLCSSFSSHLSSFTFLLRVNGSHCHATKPQLCFNTEQRLTSTDQTALKRKRNVSQFYFLNYLIFITRILEFHLIFKVKCSLGIVVGLNLELIPNISNNVKLNILSKIKNRYPSLVDWNRRILSFRAINTKS